MLGIFLGSCSQSSREERSPGVTVMSQARLTPEESKKLRSICPRCSKNLTVGVLNRVEELADRPEGYVPDNVIPYKSLVPLSELIAAVLVSTPYSKNVWETYSKLIDRFKNEFDVLLNVPEH